MNVARYRQQCQPVCQQSEGDRQHSDEGVELNVGWIESKGALCPQVIPIQTASCSYCSGHTHSLRHPLDKLVERLAPLAGCDYD
jgi:hypothetical protein